LRANLAPGLAPVAERPRVDLAATGEPNVTL